MNPYEKKNSIVKLNRTFVKSIITVDRQTEIKSSENKKNSNIYKSIQESTEKVVRPFSSPPKIQANRQLYNSKGNKRKEKLVEFKSKFNDINDASALQLHSRLKELGKLVKSVLTYT